LLAEDRHSPVEIFPAFGIDVIIVPSFKQFVISQEGAGNLCRIFEVDFFRIITGGDDKMLVFSFILPVGICFFRPGLQQQDDRNFFIDIMLDVVDCHLAGFERQTVFFAARLIPAMGVPERVVFACLMTTSSDNWIPW
jgi:hypothetical protein